MTVLRRAIDVTLAAALAVGLAGCGHQSPLRPVGATAVGAAHHRLSVKDNQPWYDSNVLLDDFNDGLYRYDPYGEQNPFFNLPVGTMVTYAGAGGNMTNRVLEILAPANESKMRRGAFVTSDIRNAPTVNTDTVPPAFADHVMVSWQWANNGVPVAPRMVYAQAIFLFSYTRPGQDEDGVAAIGYNWTNETCPADNNPNSWTHTSLVGNSTIEMRTLTIQVGQGGVNTPPVPTPCNAAAMNAMVLQSETRQFEKDVAVAYNDKFPQMASSAESMLPGCAAAQGSGFDPKCLNSRITGIIGLGGGADLPQAVCSHAIFDNFSMTRHPKSWSPSVVENMRSHN
jgi:hypothetical protein